MKQKAEDNKDREHQRGADRLERWPRASTSSKQGIRLDLGVPTMNTLFMNGDVYDLYVGAMYTKFADESLGPFCILEACLHARA